VAPRAQRAWQAFVKLPLTPQFTGLWSAVQKQSFGAVTSGCVAHTAAPHEMPSLQRGVSAQQLRRSLEANLFDAGQYVGARHLISLHLVLVRLVMVVAGSAPYKMHLSCSNLPGLPRPLAGEKNTNLHGVLASACSMQRARHFDSVKPGMCLHGTWVTANFPCDLQPSATPVYARIATLRPACWSWYSSWQRWSPLACFSAWKLHHLHGAPRQPRRSVVTAGHALPPNLGGRTETMWRDCVPPPHGQDGPQSLHFGTQSTGVGHAPRLQGLAYDMGQLLPKLAAGEDTTGVMVFVPSPHVALHVLTFHVYSQSTGWRRPRVRKPPPGIIWRRPVSRSSFPASPDLALSTTDFFAMLMRSGYAGNLLADQEFFASNQLLPVGPMKQLKSPVQSNSH